MGDYISGQRFWVVGVSLVANVKLVGANSLKVGGVGAFATYFQGMRVINGLALAVTGGLEVCNLHRDMHVSWLARGLQIVLASIRIQN